MSVWTGVFLFTIMISGLASGNVSSQRKILEEMLADYDVNEWPDFDREEPTNVSIQMFINSFGSLNAANMDYSIDIFLRQHWLDPRLAISGNKSSITIRDPLMQARIWKPDTYFHNVKDAEVHMVTMPNIQFRLNKTGHILYSMRITAELSCHLELERFPFDSQVCYALISAYANTDEIVVYKWQSNPLDLPDDLEIAQFDLLAYSTDTLTQYFSTGNFSGLLVHFFLRRQNGYHILQTYVPTILIVSISWVSFWLDPNAVPGRVSLGVTTLLTLTTLASGIRQQLPPVSYIKAIDVWVGMCMIMVFGALLEFTLVNWLANKKIIRLQSSTSYQTSSVAAKGGDDLGNGASKTYISQARLLDRISRILFPVIFLVFNIIYWPYYLTERLQDH
ncbi:Glycine receptor subunit alpha-3 [Halocaridina rubra]|uniref:Glycine receptor subunit alpha-3 n=1 Tax=Halocaridina rubra TaxID=373956 RepID=A0AAN9AH61_HALRR